VTTGHVSYVDHANGLAMHGNLQNAVHAYILLKTDASCPLEANISFYTMAQVAARRNFGKSIDLKNAPFRQKTAKKRGRCRNSPRQFPVMSGK